MSELHSNQTEYAVLCCLVKFADVFFEVDALITDKDFQNPTHRTTYSLIKDCYANAETLNKFSLIQKLTNLSITCKDDITISDYIDNFYASQHTRETGVLAAKELVKNRIRRDLYKVGGEIQKYVKNPGVDSVETIISKTDNLYNKQVGLYTSDMGALDIFENLDILIKERSDNQIEETGFVTPYPAFNRVFGGIRHSNVYVFVARPAEGKSTLLCDLASKMTLGNQDCKALILDTENLSVDIKFRLASAITGIPTWYLETGKFKDNPEYLQKYEENKDKFKTLNKKVYHLQVAGKPINEIESIAKRWYYRTVGRGNPAIIVYDYLKLTGERDGNRQEFMLIGDKANSLKELSSNLGAVVLTACQVNRSGEGGIKDDSSVIAQSDRILWYASFVAIFRRKTLDEIVDDGIEFGTHKMIPFKTRFQGKSGTGHQGLVKITKGNTIRYKVNFLNYQVENFNVEERSDLAGIIESKKNKSNVDFDSHLEDEAENIVGYK